MAQSVFKLDDVKKTFLKRIDSLPAAQKKAAIIAWNLLLAKTALSLTSKINTLVLKKAKDTIAIAKNKVKLGAIEAKNKADESTKNQGVAIFDGFKDPSIDSLKSTLLSLNDTGSNKSMILKNITNRTEANNKDLGDKITSMTNDVANLGRLKI